jgi:hypothetical protein
MKLSKRLLVLALTIVALGAFAATATGEPVGLCTETGASSDPGVSLSGTYKKLTITGNAYVDLGNTLRVNGGLTLAPGSCLEAFAASSVTINGGVHVSPGAVFGLGYGPGTYTVNGGVTADHAGSVYIGGATINGGFTSIGGGDALRNFPIKDSTFNGNVTMTGWHGFWFGFLRNTVHGNMTITNNTAVDPTVLSGIDSTEIVANHVSGNLACSGNNPLAQIGDSAGALNTVGGHATGECASLVG